MRGEDEREGGPASELALELDPPAMGPHDVLDDRESQSRPLFLSRQTVVDAVELLEDALVLGLRDAAAVVLDGDANAPIGRGRADADAPGLAAVLVRVRQEVDDRVHESIVIRYECGQIGLDAKVELD